MNYLAHAYLSFEQPGLLAGNMISDFVKGKKRFDYPPGIRHGITLHREIDRFTDSHPAIRDAKNIFRPAYRLYSGSLVDIINDHFLATDENEFSDESLRLFSLNTYKLLDGYAGYFPEKFGRMYPYMKTQNWLYNYRYLRGIEQSLAGVVRRSLYMTESDTAFRLFNEHYDLLRQCYRSFFPDVKKLAQQFVQQLND